MTLSGAVVIPFSVVFPRIDFKIYLICGAVMSIATETDGAPISGAGVTDLTIINGSP